MPDRTKTRVLGIGIFLVGIVEILVVPSLSPAINMLLAFLSGVCLGAGGAIFVTGRPLWDSDTWWASKHPGKRRGL
jgi:sugar phosphate permease